MLKNDLIRGYSLPGRVKIFKLVKMCIICSHPIIGEDYLSAINNARVELKKAENALILLGEMYPEKNYDNAHKKLVKIRKSIDKVERIREKVDEIWIDLPYTASEVILYVDLNISKQPL